MITSSPAQRPTRGSGLQDKDVTEDTGGMNADSSVSPGLSSAMRVASRKIGNKKPLKTHSRESSGASVKFVNCSSSAESNVAREYRQHRRNHSKSSGCASGTEGEDEDTESHVIILSPSEHEAGSQLSDRILIKSVGCEDEDMMSTGEELSVPSTDEELEEEEGYVERTRRKNMRGEEGCKPGEMLKSNYHSRKRTNQRRKSPWPPSPPEFETRREDCFHQPTESHGYLTKVPGNNALQSSRKPKPGKYNCTDFSKGKVVADGVEGTPEPEKGICTKQGPDDPRMVDSYQHQPLLDDISSDDEAGANSSGYTRRKSRHPREGPIPSNNGKLSSDVCIAIEDEEEETFVDSRPPADFIPKEPLKTLLAFIFLFFAWVATTTSLALAHERVPEIAPLPDVVLDNVHYQSWGLDTSEIIIMIATFAAFTLALFHQHRFIIVRRIFFLGGLHYFYRAVTMYITVLPKADPHYKCAPKLSNAPTFEIAQRVLKLLSGMGLSINGQHIYCGDYVYSGHTMTLLMTYLIIKEYSPRTWFLLHWLSFITTVTGVSTLLLARGHYSIDVLIAYWITTRLWWIYHTLANNASLAKKGNKFNYLSECWWFGIFQYFEGRVGRPLPKGFNWPLPKQLKWRPNRNHHASSSLHSTSVATARDDPSLLEDFESARAPSPPSLEQRPPRADHIVAAGSETQAPKASVENLEQ